LSKVSDAAMETVVKTRGSTPQQVGAKIVIFDDGSFIGTVEAGASKRILVPEPVKFYVPARLTSIISISMTNTKMPKVWSAGTRWI
jgi:hypothetical protein